jgi:hypothetical protein
MPLACQEIPLCSVLLLPACRHLHCTGTVSQSTACHTHRPGLRTSRSAVCERAGQLRKLRLTQALLLAHTHPGDQGMPATGTSEHSHTPGSVYRRGSSHQLPSNVVQPLVVVWFVCRLVVVWFVCSVVS